MTPLILVVDDAPEVRELIAATLRKEGYRADCAANGAEAVGWVQRERPDLILLDVSMPVMDGIRFLELLRADRATVRLPVVLLTAAADAPKVRAAAKLGVKAYLLKSEFSLPDMLRRIKEHVREALPTAPASRPSAA